MIRGGKPLEGTVDIGGSYKSALAIISASLLATTPSIINSIPRVKQLESYLRFLQKLRVHYHVHQHQVWIHPGEMNPYPAEVETFLEGMLFLPGALIGRFGKCILYGSAAEQIFYTLAPALKGFESMGVKIKQQGNRWEMSASRLSGSIHYLDQSNLECTINLMLAAAGSEEQTVIHHAAKDPEVIDVAMYLNRLGANIKGAGTDSIRIQGVKGMQGSTHTLIPDRIEAGILLLACAGAGGGIELNGVIPEHVEAVTLKLKEMGVDVQTSDDSISISRKNALSSVDVKGYLYPGIPLDLQQPFSSLLTQAKGTSLVIDPVFSSRLQPVEELKSMGARIKTDGRTTVIEGPTPLYGVTVKASDAISGTSLVIAGLMASGVTEIEHANHIDEWFEALDVKLQHLGAEIWRKPV